MIRTIFFILLVGAVVFLVGTALHWHMPDLFSKQPQPINFQPLGRKLTQ